MNVRRMVPRIAASGILTIAALSIGCHPQAKSKANKVAEVYVTSPITTVVTDYEDFTGRMDARETVDIRPRVSGYVQEAPFREGDIVHEGDLLYQIDPRTYEADLHLAEANLKLAEAGLRLAIRNLDRGRKLVSNGSIGKEEYDALLADHEKAVASVGSMKANRDRAKLYLGFTRVTAPMSGRISRNLVDPGNLVNADQTILTTLVTEGSLYGYFDVDERSYLDLATTITPEAEYSSSGSRITKRSFPVLMRLANEEEFTRIGYVDFRDNRLNANTGTITMRGVFDNPGHLKSGLFVRVRLPKGKPQKAWLVPDEAVLSDQGRKYVFIVTDKDENGKDAIDDKGNPVERVAYRSVTLGKSLQGLRVLKFDAKANQANKDGTRKNALTLKELKNGVRVIVKGMQRVREGSLVRSQTVDKPKTPRAPLTELLADKGVAAR